MENICFTSFQNTTGYFGIDTANNQRAAIYRPSLLNKRKQHQQKMYPGEKYLFR